MEDNLFEDGKKFYVLSKKSPPSSKKSPSIFVTYSERSLSEERNYLLSSRLEERHFSCSSDSTSPTNFRQVC